MHDAEDPAKTEKFLRVVGQRPTMPKTSEVLEVSGATVRRKDFRSLRERALVN